MSIVSVLILRQNRFLVFHYFVQWVIAEMTPDVFRSFISIFIGFIFVRFRFFFIREFIILIQISSQTP